MEPACRRRPRPLVKPIAGGRTVRPTGAAAEVLAHAWLQDPTRGEGFRDKAAAKAASGGVAQEFHLGRRRCKAMLLAVMVGTRTKR